nr:Gag-Pol polyprotein [Tanacetum cinerariifolium]
MEILLEPTSNKLLVVGNPVKEILLKLNLPDHKLILADSKEHIKMDVEKKNGKQGNLRVLAKTKKKQKNVKEAITDPTWIDSMQEELLQFKRLDVWVLVPAPDNISPLTLKWLFKNKNDEEQTVIRNKSRLVV